MTNNKQRSTINNDQQQPTTNNDQRQTTTKYEKQGWAYRIEKLSNADISDFSVYRRVYCIEPPISSISIFSKPVIVLYFFAENSPKIQKIPRNFRKPMNQSPQQQQ